MAMEGKTTDDLDKGHLAILAAKVVIQLTCLLRLLSSRRLEWDRPCFLRLSRIVEIYFLCVPDGKSMDRDLTTPTKRSMLTQMLSWYSTTKSMSSFGRLLRFLLLFCLAGGHRLCR